MKSTIQRVLFAVAVATLGAGAVGTACAQSTSSAPGGAPANGGHRGHFRHFGGGGRFVGALLRATKQLNLSQDQQSTIKTILSSARHNHQRGGERPDLTVVGNPSDPGFASAVQGAAAQASNSVQQDSTLAGEIYAVLTPTQQKQLHSVLASIQAQEQARRAAWAAKHATGNG
jgi:Spy/CpxP family protein refolding chaperone